MLNRLLFTFVLLNVITLVLMAGLNYSRFDAGATRRNGVFSYRSEELRRRLRKMQSLSAAHWRYGGAESSQPNGASPLEDQELSREAIRAEFEYYFDRQYAPFLEKLPTVGGIRESLATLLRQRVLQIQNLKKGNSEDLATAEIGRINDSFEKSVRKIVGERQAAELKDFEDTIPYRNLAAELRNALRHSETPLSDSMARELVEVLKREAPRGEAMAAPLTADETISDVLGVSSATLGNTELTKAGTVLSPKQLAVLERLDQYNRARRRLGEMDSGY
jgi:hypothetical protein